MSGRHVIIACGGTGGHLSPGIALAESLLERGHRATLLISHKKVDTKLVAKYPGLRFLRVPGTGLTLSPSGVARFLVSQAQGLAFSSTLLARETPDAVVGFGGFTTSTIILTAALRRIPIFLHEANRVPGKAIRVMQPLARRVYLPPGVRLPRVPADRQAGLPLPVRSEIRRLDSSEARRRWGLRADRPVVSVLGGSQGASALNEWARSSAADLASRGVQLVCVTGMGKGEDTRVEQPSDFGPIPQVTLSFCDDMAALFSASDVMVTRAGAGTLAEMARCGTPGVLVPFPHAADDHQAANAAYFAERGGGAVIDQKKMQDVLPQVLRWLQNPDELTGLKAGLAAMGAEDAVGPMIEDMERSWRYGT